MNTHLYSKNLSQIGSENSLINDSTLIQDSSRISRVLFHQRPKNFQTLAVVESNILAVEAGLLFGNLINKFQVVIGPSGWGKTHLLTAIQEKFQSKYSSFQIVNASDWALGLVKLNPNEPLLLDNAQEAFSFVRIRQALGLALERRLKTERPTLICFSNGHSDRQLRSFLPNGRHWNFAQINSPTHEEKILVAEQIARTENFEIHPSLIKLIAFRVKGSGNALVGVIKRLWLEGHDCNNPLSITKACGTILPFLSDHNPWDPRDSIYHSVVEETPEMNSNTRDSLAIYLMLKEANLSETLVAGYFGSDPADVYVRANAFAGSFLTSDRNIELMKRVLKRTAENLANDCI